jgi:hypothetical protein
MYTLLPAGLDSYEHWSAEGGEEEERGKGGKKRRGGRGEEDEGGKEGEGMGKKERELKGKGEGGRKEVMAEVHTIIV